MAQERILIADDEPYVLELCQRILTAEGYRVATVRAGQEAVERIKQQPFDLLLTDIKMPGMDGLQTAQAVKEIHPAVICVTMTGYSTMDTAIQALKLGVDEFIMKPFTREELSLSIARALEKERLRKENIRLQSLIPLFEFNKTLLSTMEVDTLLHHVLELAQRETQADVGIVFLDNSGEISEHMDPASLERNNQVRSLYLELSNWIMQYQQYLSLCRGEPFQVSSQKVGANPCGCPPGQVQNLPLPQDIEKIPFQERFKRLLEGLDVEFLVGLPLVAKEGRSLGALVLGKRSQPFASGDSEFLQVMAGQAAIAIENAHLFQEIQQAYDELKKLDQMKSKFINIAAHELRTPLAILLGYASVMAEEASGAERNGLDVITRNATRLRVLIDDMLNLSYLETGQAQLKVEEVILRDAIQETVHDMEDMAKEKSLEIEVNVPADFPPMLADRQKLDLIVMNLLSNAIKYTPEGGHIWFEAGLNGDKAAITVTDTGIGIPPEEYDKIFDRFYQVADSLTRRQGGIGLGLAIVKSLVELCQGRIWVESEVGKGSAFIVELPLRQSQ
jgi:signal transduction histidine kinase/DNA-binding response OmpR family regulator